ncbi:MAG TPA: DNA polymerase/3'-5' exonuclease PolX [Solirubrobacteraceae bacterium]|nr:DNA polymerase/3'-5' exonuclease PolX [Solirubrobacteraceae bacterium]
MSESAGTAPTNSEIAAAFDELGDLYELDGATIHRIVAYRNGARAVRDASKQVAQLAVDGQATTLPGIGATLQEKIVALATTGEIPALVKLRSKFPPGLVEMTRLPGLGPKRARRLYEELGLDSLEALKDAAAAGRISELKGFGPKAEQALLEAVADYAEAGPTQRIVLSRALAVGEELLAEIRALKVTEQAELAGSARRMGESVKDLDIVATASDPGALAAAVARLPQVEAASTPGTNAVRIRTHSGIGVDVRIVEPDQFGNVLQHLTGSKQHNVALRDFAVRRGMHISEYGVLDDSSGVSHRCATEAEVYALLGMDYIEPELREDRGELDAALAHALPELVTAADLKGDLHCHTSASDGTASVEEMAQAAIDAGYEYLVITDHSASMGFGADVSTEQLRHQIERVREVDGSLPGFTLLVGSEVNVLPDGTLDYPDDVLAELDWVVASVHTSFRMPEAEMTARIVHAIEHPYVDCIGHLSGRKILQRAPYEFDFEAIVEAAARTGTMLEINSNPDRRDLNELHARDAAAAGIPLVINCDAHRTGGFEVVRYGVATARRAWLTPSQIANTRAWTDLAAQRSRLRAA